MRRLATIVAVAALALTGTAATATQKTTGSFKKMPVPTQCTAQAFKVFSAKVWRLIYWERGTPKETTIKAQRRRLACAPPAHLKVMQKTWRRDKSAYNRHRKYMIGVQRWEPYVCNGEHYALPCAIVVCESGYYFGHHSGAYGILDSTWAYYAYPPIRASYPGAGTRREQAIVATRVLEDNGFGAWECPL